MYNIKSFIRKACGTTIALLMLLSVLFTLTGCSSVDDTQINKAFANSAIMNSIHKHLQDQAAFVDKMLRMGIITPNMAEALNAETVSITKGVQSLTNGGTVEDPNAAPAPTTSSDPNATPSTLPPVQITSGDPNPFIITVLKSMSAFSDGSSRDGYTQVTGLDKKEAAAANVQEFGTPLDLYGGYPTKKVIEKVKDSTCNFQAYNDTNYDGIAAYNQGKKLVPLYPYGDPSNDTSPVNALVDRLNSLTDIEVCYINPDKVKTSADLQRLKTEMDDAKTGKEKDTDLMSHFFNKVTDDKINLAAGLSKETAYADNPIDVYDGGAWVATYHMYELNENAILGAFGGAQGSADLSSGVLIGNYYFVTRYPVAVFRGFEQSTTDKTKYLPVFTHPQFLVGSSYGDSNLDGKIDSSDTGLKGSLFTPGTSTYNDSLTAGDSGTAETKCAYVDLYSGAMYYRGEKVGNTNAYMGIGTADLESSVMVKSSSDVFAVKDNPSCITTATTDTTAFQPTETLNITSAKSIKLPNKTGSGVMPVVFLMDYLELAYSPNTVGSDAFTAYGRKVKLDESVILGKDALTSASGSVAYIVGEGATKTDWASSKSNYPSLAMTDFMDIDGIYKTDLSAKGKDTAGEANNVSASVHYIPAGTASFEQPGTLRSGDAASERSDNLPQIAAGSGVECVMRFGATNLDATDSGAEPKIPLYGITLYGGLYDRQLFSDWINASGNANLTKWAKTIKDLGYPNYAVSNAVLTERLKNNYAFELNQDGLLNIDLNTVIQIDKQKTEERRGDGVRYLRTILLILGAVLISYVSVLLASWALDVNLDLGLNLLEKVSFSHFVAVRSLDEMPEPDPDSTTTYVDFRRLIIRCLAFAVVGVILIAIDPVNLIVKLLGTLNFLINILSEKLFGTKIM